MSRKTFESLITSYIHNKECRFFFQQFLFLEYEKILLSMKFAPSSRCCDRLFAELKRLKGHVSVVWIYSTSIWATRSRAESNFFFVATVRSQQQYFASFDHRRRRRLNCRLVVVAIIRTKGAATHMCIDLLKLAIDVLSKVQLLLPLLLLLLLRLQLLEIFTTRTCVLCRRASNISFFLSSLSCGY